MADTITQYDNTYDRRTAELDKDDTIQHGIDNDPTGDAEKGAVGGAIGGAIVGATAGAILSPAGAVLGAIVGGVIGGVASGEAVAVVDRHDNDNTISGLGSTPTIIDPNDPYVNSADTTSGYTSIPVNSGTAYAPTAGVGNGVLGIQTGGHDIDGSPDTRGIWEKTADAVTSDNIDDKTGEPVSHDTVRSDGYAVGNTVHNDTATLRNDLRGDTDTLRNDAYTARSAADSGIGTGISRETELGERTASLKTGGVANDGTPDTRGIGEKFVDGLTGDDVDDKTGRIVNHP
jgi:hypothetical protein